MRPPVMRRALLKTSPAPRFDRGVVEVGECGGAQIAADAGVVELPLSVVALGAEGAGQGVADAGTGASGALIEVAGVLVQERGQHGAAEQDVAGPSWLVGAEAFEVAPGALDVGGVSAA